MGKSLGDNEVLIRIVCVSATKIAKVFEALRRSGIFEELVVTGISPSRFEASYRGYAVARLSENVLNEEGEFNA